MKKIILALSLALLLLPFVASQEFPDYYNKYVNDFAGIFTPEETTHLQQILSEVESNTTAEIVVVTVESTAPLTPQQYRTELFNTWHVGKADKDNGLLILYAVKENRIEVETGYGMEGILPDGKLGRMLDDYYVPERDAGNPKAGIIAFTQEAAKVIQENRDEVISGNADGTLTKAEILFPIIFMVVIFSAIVALIAFSFKASRSLPAKTQTKSAKSTKDKNAAYSIIMFLLLFFLGMPLVILAAALLVIYVHLHVAFAVIAAIAYIVGAGYFVARIPKVCSIDGLKLTKSKSDILYNYYTCPKGHVLKLPRTVSQGQYYAGHHHSGGGFSGGGGGFGGGSSGGGGAGR